MSLLACGMCGGIVESGAIVAVMSASVALTHLRNKWALAAHKRREAAYLRKLTATAPGRYVRAAGLLVALAVASAACPAEAASRTTASGSRSHHSASGSHKAGSHHTHKTGSHKPRPAAHHSHK